MKREGGLQQIERDPASCVTVGTFDGVHVGHQAILRYLVARAVRQQQRSVVVSFDPHPREVLTGQPVALLTTIEERAAVFASLGLDRFICLPFSPSFARLSAEAFVREVLVERIGLSEIVIGYDHGFGQGRAGDAGLLEQLGAELGFTVDVIPAQEVEHHIVSSTEIRTLLLDHGDVRLAAEMLGRPYAVTGTVVRGDQRGRTIGFPTANLAPDHPRKVIPKRGVYAVRVAMAADAEALREGMMNIGLRPTFNGTHEVMEAHLFDFSGDLYGRQLRIEFVERIRDERKFDGAADLVEQLSKDQVRCTDALKTLP